MEVGRIWRRTLQSKGVSGKTAKKKIVGCGAFLMRCQAKDIEFKAITLYYVTFPPLNCT